MAKLDFWCEIASTYTYLAAMRIEKLADAAGVEVRWQPFSLGPIFAAAGWSTSPFELYADKGRYMWRDIEREAEQLGLAMRDVCTFQPALAAPNLGSTQRYTPRRFSSPGQG